MIKKKALDHNGLQKRDCLTHNAWRQKKKLDRGGSLHRHNSIFSPITTGFYVTAGGSLDGLTIYPYRRVSDGPTYFTVYLPSYRVLVIRNKLLTQVEFVRK